MIKDFLIDNFSWIISDKLYLIWKFKKNMGYSLNLNSPKSFSEKLQWLKLYDRKPLYTSLVDKYAVKDFIKKKIGDEYIIPTIGAWDRPEDIDWDSLPDRFVLKTTHGGGGTGVVICKDKATFDKDAAIKCMNKSLSLDLYVHSKEWPYKNVPKRVIAEQYMEDENGELNDYKLFCFNGKVKVLFVATGRFKNLCFDFFDENGKILPIDQMYPHANPVPQIPDSYAKMKELAEKLSQDIPFVRVDFYTIGNKVYFGEMTFFHDSGMVPINPIEWDYKLGEWLELPTVKTC